MMLKSRCMIAGLASYSLLVLTTNNVEARKKETYKHPSFPRVSLDEAERIQEWHRRNYTWPIEKFYPETEGWNKLMNQRIAQVQAIEDRGERYEGFVQTIRSSIVAPNFTEYGFGLARCPDDLLGALQEGIREGLPNARYENDIPVINGNRCKFINRSDLTRRVLEELHDYTETWAGIPLIPYRAYGFRLYQNNSQLSMHVDKLQTHVLSFILHIDSSEDAEPWPIFIEDLHGRTHEVTLTPGDMLFYESSKCFHGRPKRLNGSWYTSVFVHYYPKYGWKDVDHDLDVAYAIPPQWIEQGTPPENLPPLQMKGTAMEEPGCENEWCRTGESIKWSGPGERGYWIDANQQKHPFHPEEVVWNEEL